MTQLYYTKKVLPHHIKELRKSEQKTGKHHILQEDNDPSHGTRSKLNYAQLHREKCAIQSLVHPAHSPDLNPIEAIWNILKQRVRQRYWYSMDELKRVILDEWNKISQAEIQARIKEMPYRCNLLVENGGKAIKSSMW